MMNQVVDQKMIPMQYYNYPQQMFYNNLPAPEQQVFPQYQSQGYMSPPNIYGSVPILPVQQQQQQPPQTVAPQQIQQQQQHLPPYQSQQGQVMPQFCGPYPGNSYAPMNPCWSDPKQMISPNALNPYFQPGTQTNEMICNPSSGQGYYQQMPFFLPPNQYPPQQWPFTHTQQGGVGPFSPNDHFYETRYGNGERFRNPTGVIKNLGPQTLKEDLVKNRHSEDSPDKKQMHQQSTDETVKKQTNYSKKPYKDTKNIPKNYTKAILRYLRQHQESLLKFLGNFEMVKKFLQRIENKKDKIISIREFKSLFENVETDSEETKLFCKVFRIMSYKFIRQEILPYLLQNKKIKDIESMFKYRRIIVHGLSVPDQFVCWKFINPERIKKRK